MIEALKGFFRNPKKVAALFVLVAGAVGWTALDEETANQIAGGLAALLMLF